MANYGRIIRGALDNVIGRSHIDDIVAGIRRGGDDALRLTDDNLALLADDIAEQLAEAGVRRLDPADARALKDAVEQELRASGVPAQEAAAHARALRGQVSRELPDAVARTGSDAVRAGADEGADAAETGARNVDEAPRPPASSTGSEVNSIRRELKDAMDSNSGISNVSGKFDDLENALRNDNRLVDSIDDIEGVSSVRSPREIMRVLDEGGDVAKAELDNLQSHFSRYHRAADNTAAAAGDAKKGFTQSLLDGGGSFLNKLGSAITYPGRTLGRMFSAGGHATVGAWANGISTTILGAVGVTGASILAPFPGGGENDSFYDVAIVNFDEMLFDGEWRNDDLLAADPSDLGAREAAQRGYLENLRASAASSSAEASTRERENVLAEQAQNRIDNQRESGANRVAEMRQMRGGENAGEAIGRVEDTIASINRMYPEIEVNIDLSDMINEAARADGDPKLTTEESRALIASAEFQNAVEGLDIDNVDKDRIYDAVTGGVVPIVRQENLNKNNNL